MSAPRFSADLTDGFFVRLDQVAEELQAQARDLLAVWYSESGLRADAWNPHGDASGIFQAMPAILMGLGWPESPAAYRKLTALRQLEWAVRYYRPHRGRLVSVGAIYTATFLPALLSKANDPHFVLCAKNGPLGWAFAPNAVFDTNGDMAITVGELEEAVHRNCRGPRWEEIVSRLDGPPADEAVGLVAEEVDLRTTFGIQRALARLGFDPGPIDGLPGAKTAAAVAEFQEWIGLKADGIFGPRSSLAMAEALQTATPRETELA